MSCIIPFITELLLKTQQSLDFQAFSSLPGLTKYQTNSIVDLICHLLTNIIKILVLVSCFVATTTTLYIQSLTILENGRQFAH